MENFLQTDLIDDEIHLGTHGMTKRALFVELRSQKGEEEINLYFLHVFACHPINVCKLV